MVVLPVVILVALASQAARFLVVDRPEKSDAIVVLAGETNVRPARALELLRQAVAPRVLFDAETRDSDLRSAPDRHCTEIRERPPRSKQSLGMPDRWIFDQRRGHRYRPLPAVAGRASRVDRDLRLSHPPRPDDPSPSPAAIPVQCGRGSQSGAIRRRLVVPPRMGKNCLR